jgi:hypothetical protein
MRMIKLLLIGTALSLAAAPVAAQNAADTNVTDVAMDNAAGATNDVAAAPSDVAAPTDPNAMEPIDSNTGAIDTGYVEPAPAPVDSDDGGFPWGLLGLLGLLGLIPRLRRGS